MHSGFDCVEGLDSIIANIIVDYGVWKSISNLHCCEGERSAGGVGSSDVILQCIDKLEQVVMSDLAR